MGIFLLNYYDQFNSLLFLEIRDRRKSRTQFLNNTLYL